MGKKSIDYTLKGDYLDIYHKSDLYLSFRKDYMNDVDPTICEVVDILTQAQVDNAPVEEIIGPNLIGFLKHVDSAFNSRVYYKSLSLTHLIAVVLSILLGFLRTQDRTLIDYYFYYIISDAIVFIILFITRQYISKRINKINLNRARFITKFKFQLHLIVVIIIFTFVPSTNIDISSNVFYLVSGLSLMPLIVLAIIDLVIRNGKKIDKNVLTKKNTEPSKIETLIMKIEKIYIKKSLKRISIGQKPLSDQEVSKILVRNRRVIYTLYPLISIGYILLIGYLINIQVLEGFSSLLSGFIGLLLLIFSICFAALSMTKYVSTLIYHLQIRDRDVFDKGAIPNEYFKKELRWTL